MQETKLCAAIISKFNEDDIIQSNYQNSKYIVVLNALDGISNYDANISIASIFSIYKRPQIGNEKPVNASEIFYKGSESIIISGYCLYSAII